MFILRIGAEALKNSDHSLSSNYCIDNGKHSNFGKMKLNKGRYQTEYQINKDKPVDQGILYNLLKRNKQSSQLDNNHNIEMNTLSLALMNNRPNSSNLESVKSFSSKSTSIRPSSAPQTTRFHPYNKPKQFLNSELSKNFDPDQRIIEWLRSTVSLMKPNKSNELMLLNVLQLPDSDRIRILKQSWHLIFITYLVEFIETIEKTKTILGLFIKDYYKSENNGNYKKLFRLTKVFTTDLEIVINQMINLRLNHNLFELLRIAILFTDNHEDIKKKNIELLKPRLGSRSDEYYTLFDQFLDNLFKLDMSMIESVFCGHLFPSVDGIIDELYSNI